LACDRHPCSVGRATRLVDIVLDVLGDGGVEPGDDARINLQAINMIDKPELLEREFKEGTPLTEVSFIRRQFDRNVAVDVEENYR